MTEHNRLPKPLSNEVLADNVRAGGEVGADALLELVERATSGNCTFTLAAVKEMCWLPPGLVDSLTRERDDARAQEAGLRKHLDVQYDACNRSEAQVAVYRQALEQAADKLDVIRRCTINSRTAPNVLDTVADVSLWARDDAREALAADVVVGQPEEVSEPGATSSAENTQPGGSGADHTAKAGDAEAELVTSQTEGMANSAAPGSLTSPVVGQPGESPADTGDASERDEWRRASVRPWPKDVTGASKGETTAFIKRYREAFDADPNATYCAGEIDGVTLIVAVGAVGERLQAFVRNELHGKIQRRKTSTTADSVGLPAPASPGSRVGGNAA